MSETIKEIFTNYMICAAAGGLLEYIVPQNSKKIMRVLLVVVLLSVTLCPILDADTYSWGFDSVEYEEIESYEGLLHIRNLTEKKVREQMQEVVIKAGADEYEIYITTDADEETNTVYLDKVEVLVDREFEYLADHIKNNAPEEYRSIVEVGVK